MSFRKFGGIQYSAKHNIVHSFVHNATTTNILKSSGVPNSTEVFDCNLLVHGALTVSGTTTLQSDLITQGNATIDGNLTVSGTTTLQSDLYTYGNAALERNLTVSGNTVLHSDLDVYGTTYINDLHVLGETHLTNNTTISGTMTIYGTLSVNGQSVFSPNRGITTYAPSIFNETSTFNWPISFQDGTQQTTAFLPLVPSQTYTNPLITTDSNGVINSISSTSAGLFNTLHLTGPATTTENTFDSSYNLVSRSFVERAIHAAFVSGVIPYLSSISGNIQVNSITTNGLTMLGPATTSQTTFDNNEFITKQFVSSAIQNAFSSGTFLDITVSGTFTANKFIASDISAHTLNVDVAATFHCPVYSTQSDFTHDDEFVTKGFVYQGIENAFLSGVLSQLNTISGNFNVNSLVANQVFISGLLTVNAPTTTNQTSFTSNSLVTKKYVDQSISGNITTNSLNVVGNTSLNGNLTVNGLTTNISVGGTMNTGNMNASGLVRFTNSTDSISKDTGSFTLDGGLGVEKSVFIGNHLSVSGNISFSGLLNGILANTFAFISGTTSNIQGQLSALQNATTGQTYSGGITTFGSGNKVNFVQLPTCSASPTLTTELCPKTYVDNRSVYLTNPGVVNTWQSQNDFFGWIPTTSSTPTGNTQLCNKLYVDSTISATISGNNATLKSSANTWTNTNIFTGNLLTSSLTNAPKYSPIIAKVSFRYSSGSSADIIGSSYNVSSITRNNTGIYTLNLTVAPPSNIYLIFGNGFKSGTNGLLVYATDKPLTGSLTPSPNIPIQVQSTGGGLVDPTTGSGFAYCDVIIYA